MKKLPGETTSSMQIDFKNNRQTEVETLTGYVVNKSADANLDVPAYKNIYHQLKKIK